MNKQKDPGTNFRYTVDTRDRIRTFYFVCFDIFPEFIHFLFYTKTKILLLNVFCIFFYLKIQNALFIERYVICL